MQRSLMAGSIFSSKTTDTHESPNGRMRKGSLVKGVKHLLVDAAEAAVRHEDDEIAVGVLAGNHIDDLIERRRIASALPGERHYAVTEIAELWNLSADKVRDLFQNEPGVLVIGERSPRRKRRYVTLRIPQSVLERVHSRLSSKMSAW